jgi:hypothetical protein
MEETSSAGAGSVLAVGCWAWARERNETNKIARRLVRLIDIDVFSPTCK